MTSFLKKLGYSAFGGVVGGTALSVGVLLVQHENITFGYLVEGLLVGFFLGLQSAPRTLRKDVLLSVGIITAMTLLLLTFNANAFLVNILSLIFAIQYVVIAAFFLGGGSWLFAEKLKD